MDNRKKIRWIARTALLIALLIVLQAASAPLGNSLITGSIVNLMLIISAMVCGLSTGLTVALTSPVAAKFFGIGPLWALIPFIAAGNIALVLLWHFIGNRRIGGRQCIAYIAALVAAALAKFFALYIGIVQIAVPGFLNLPEPQAAVVSNMFSVPQLLTALAGGILAIILLPGLKKAIAGGTA